MIYIYIYIWVFKMHSTGIVHTFSLSSNWNEPIRENKKKFGKNRIKYKIPLQPMRV